LDPALVNETIVMLVEKLEPLGQRIWEAYTRQVVIDGILAILIMGIYVGLSIYGVQRLWPIAKEDTIDSTAAWICIAVILLFAFIVFVIGIAYGRCIINPDYCAVQRLLEHAIPGKY